MKWTYRIILLLISSIALYFSLYNSPEFDIEISFKDGSIINHDVSVLLDQCFVEPNNRYIEKEFYEEFIKDRLKTHDNAYLIEKKSGKIIGFASIKHIGDLEYHSFSFSYVCIAKEYRGQRLAKILMNQLEAEAINHYNLEENAKSQGNPGEKPPILFGIYSEFDSPTFQDAFSLYVSMGYLRWWNLCDEEDEFDYTGHIKSYIDYKGGKISKFGNGLSSIEAIDNFGLLNQEKRRIIGLYRFHNDNFRKIGIKLKEKFQNKDKNKLNS